MIEIIHKNKDIETLVKVGRSNRYREVSKRTFVKSLRAFYALLGIIEKTNELTKYHYLKYQQTEQSSVLIVGASISRRLIFGEDDGGKKIHILDFR